MVLPPLKNYHSKHVETLTRDLALKSICIVGLGYIGLPAAALLANRGYSIHGVDINDEAVATINKGDIHIVEPDLLMFVKAAVDSGRLKAHKSPAPADVFVICVPTPFCNDESDIPQPDISYVIGATEAIAPFVKKSNLVIIESTCPVGTTEHVAETLQSKGVDINAIHLAYCPERVLPGRVMFELVENDRIVGGYTPDATAHVAAFYRSFVVGEVLETNCRTAEMSKLTENASRDAQIAFANELSMTCDTLGINVWELINLANHHPRVNILSPGAGVGGHCIAVDPWFIVATDPEHTKMIRQARITNNTKTTWCIEKITAAAEQFKTQQNRDAVVACMGLAFKPNIDDLRESPALKIFQKLRDAGLNVIGVEPNVQDERQPQLGITADIANSIQKADIVVFLVAHQEFRRCETGSGRVVLDFCGVREI